MNSESPRLRSTGTTSSDIGAIWAGALVVVYLSATSILLLIGHSRVSVAGVLLHFAMLVAIATATWIDGVPRWLRDWAPLVLLFLLYAELPLLMRAAGRHGWYDHVVIGWEQATFGSQPALTWSTAWPSILLSEFLHAAYLSYYGIIFSVPAVLYVQRRRTEFDEAVFTLMLCFVACFAAYVAFPVAGPRYLWPSGSMRPGPIRALTLRLLEAGSSKGTAFPSSHVAVSVTQSILALHYFGAKRGAIVAALSTGLALGAVYGGFHYAIDVGAGALLGVATAFVGLRLTARWTFASSRERKSADVSGIATIVRQ